MSKLSISLSNNISCEYLCSSIQKLVSKYGDVSNKLLVIEIKDIIESNQSLLLKLEFKDDNRAAY